jgi:hypothetical protein
MSFARIVGQLNRRSNFRLTGFAEHCRCEEQDKHGGTDETGYPGSPSCYPEGCYQPEEKQSYLDSLLLADIARTRGSSSIRNLSKPIRSLQQNGQDYERQSDHDQPNASEGLRAQTAFNHEHGKQPHDPNKNNGNCYPCAHTLCILCHISDQPRKDCRPSRSRGSWCPVGDRYGLVTATLMLPVFGVFLGSIRIL